MVSQKQLLANLQNAQQSKGPITIEGKQVVAKNATKHGIFTKDLIIASGPGRENQAEYEELLTNLTQCLSPYNQMESLLVEKIAVDFWRLRRTIRFEAGSISKHIEDVVKERYSYSRSDNRTIDTQIEFAKERIVWNTAYLKCLKKNEVSFDQPIWEGKNISSDVVEDFRLIARSLPNLTIAEREQIHEDEHIATRLIELYSDENKKLKQEVEELQQKKANNQEEDFRNAMIGAAPSDETTERALKYERSIQKSIFQNLFLLKKLQGMF